MIINIWKKQDLNLVKELPIEVLFTIEDTIEILDENYSTRIHITYRRSWLHSASFLYGSDFVVVVICEKKLREMQILMWYLVEMLEDWTQTCLYFKIIS